MDSQPSEFGAARSIQTGGGAYIGESVQTGGGDFVGRDQVTIEQVTVYITQVRRADQPIGWNGHAPYVGLSSFRENQADLFFGREKLVTLLIGKLKTTRFLCISGPSGSGKSSLVQAGIVPALRANHIAGSNTWLIETLTPSNQPLENLALALGRLAKSPDAATYMRSHTDDPTTLHAQVEALLSHHPDQRAVIVVDQFEELFTQTKNETIRQPFLNLLTHAAQQENGRVLVLLVMRSDFVSQCATYPTLRKLLSGHIELVGAMEPEELARAIALPALQVGVEVKPDLVAQVINDMAGEPGALPLMEFALDDLFDAQPKQIGQPLALTRREYLLRGGLQQALARHAEAAFKQLSTTQQAIARTIFMHLIEVGRGTVDTRRTATFAELVHSGVDASQVTLVEQILADARLITTEDQQMAQISEAAPQHTLHFSTHTVTLAHEALINAWPWLKQLVRENRSAIELQNQINEDAATWVDSQHDASYLYTGARLQTVQEQQAANQIMLSELATAFIATGVQEQRRRIRNWYILTSAIGGLILAILGAIIFGQSQLATQRQKAASTLQAEVFVQQTSEAKANREADARAAEVVVRTNAQATAEASLIAAQTQLRRTKAGELTAASQFEVAQPVSDPSLALLLAMQAVTMTHPEDGQIFINTISALDNAIRKAPPWQMTLQGIDVKSATFSPDGKRIVTVDNHTAKIWDATTGKDLLTLQDHTDLINSAAFSPDGRRIVTADNHAAKIWDATTGKDLVTLQGHTYTVVSAAFSPDGKRIVTASLDNTAQIWDATTGKDLVTLQGHTYTVASAAFSPDGKRIVTADNQTAQIWDVATGKDLLTLHGHMDGVASAAFSSDGKRIVTASFDQTAKVWDATTGENLLTIQGHTDRVRSAMFSPDDKRIVTASLDHTAKVWDATTGKELLNLQGHMDGVVSAAFSPDGRHIVTASEDQTAKVWDATMSKKLLTLQGYPYSVVSAAFSSDGKRIVTASDDQTAKIWDAATGKDLLTLQGHMGGVLSAAFSSDGKHIVTASEDQTAKVWDAATGKDLLTLQGHMDSVLSATFSPDGKRIVTASLDHTAKIWDAATGKDLLTLQGHIDGIRSAAFSPDGKRIVTGSHDQTAKVWDATTGKNLLTLQGHTDLINSVTFSPDGKRIVTASDDRTAKIWDATTGKELLTLQGHMDSVLSATFSPDGKRIVTASSDNTARTWFSSVEVYVAAAARLVQRYPLVFMVEERQRYRLDELSQLLVTPTAQQTTVARPDVPLATLTATPVSALPK